MGIAAGQARIFLLTARDHDLTYRGNAIMQDRLLLASSQEKVSKEYARKTGNRQMTFTTTVLQGQTNTPVTRNLTYELLRTAGSGDAANQTRYRVKNIDGAIVVAQLSEIPTSGRVQNSDGSYSVGSQVYVIDKKINDQAEVSNYLQEGLRNGAFYIESEVATIEADGSVTRSWQSTGWSGDANFDDVLYTADDAKAKAEYDAAMSRVQQQDKRYEIEQKDIETQHKMVTTEKEAIVKLTLSNAEKGAKMFSG